jgi:protocatechuate 3,4-dioxygenase beta subunit
MLRALCVRWHFDDHQSVRTVSSLPLKGTTMRSAIVVVLIVLLAASASLRAAEPPQYKFTLTVKSGDAKPVAVNASYPRETVHELPVTKTLKFEIQTPSGREEYPATSVTLIDESSGSRTELATTRDGSPIAKERVATFVVCSSSRVILQNPSPKEPAHCSDLLPMAKPDPIIGRCGDCTGPYEGMPDKLTARSRIAPLSEPGEPLTVTGQVFGADGKPRAGVIIYAYHTDEHGIYREPNPPRSTASNHHGTLRGWAATDAQGRYTFDTIRPANYPNTTEPAHIHMHVIERGCATYFIDELVFSDDSKLTPAMRERVSQGRGGKAIATPGREGAGKPWQVVRDIYLGKDIPDYPKCPGS